MTLVVWAGLSCAPPGARSSAQPRPDTEFSPEHDAALPRPVGRGDAAEPGPGDIESHRGPEAGVDSAASADEAPASRPGADPGGAAEDATRPTDTAGDTTAAGKLPRPGVGKELLWIDREMTFTGTRFDQPSPFANWKSPVDYHGGTIQVRVVVKRKPDALPVWLELIFWSTGIQKGIPHMCLACIPPTKLTKPGEYACSATPSARAAATTGPWACFSGAVDWTNMKGPFQFSAKVSSGDSRVPTELSGARTPLEIRYTAVLVPAGATFSGWSNYR